MKAILLFVTLLFLASTTRAVELVPVNLEPLSVSLSTFTCSGFFSETGVASAELDWTSNAEDCDSAFDFVGSGTARIDFTDGAILLESIGDGASDGRDFRASGGAKFALDIPNYGDALTPIIFRLTVAQNVGDFRGFGDLEFGGKYFSEILGRVISEPIGNTFCFGNTSSPQCSNLFEFVAGDRVTLNLDDLDLQIRIPFNTVTGQQIPASGPFNQAMTFEAFALKSYVPEPTHAAAVALGAICALAGFRRIRSHRSS